MELGSTLERPDGLDVGREQLPEELSVVRPENDDGQEAAQTGNERKTDNKVIDFRLSRFRFDLKAGSGDRPEEGGRSEADPDRPEQVFDESRISDDLEEGEQRNRHPHAGQLFLNFIFFILD